MARWLGSVRIADKETGEVEELDAEVDDTGIDSAFVLVRAAFIKSHPDTVMLGITLYEEDQT